MQGDARLSCHTGSWKALARNVDLVLRDAKTQLIYFPNSHLLLQGIWIEGNQWEQPIADLRDNYQHPQLK